MNGADAHGETSTKSATKVRFLTRLFGRKKVSGSTAEEQRVTDYEFLSKSINLTFSWSVALEAHQEVVKAAIEAEVGLFDACGDEGVYRNHEQLKRLIEC